MPLQLGVALEIEFSRLSSRFKLHQGSEAGVRLVWC